LETSDLSTFIFTTIRNAIYDAYQNDREITYKHNNPAPAYRISILPKQILDQTSVVPKIIVTELLTRIQI